MVDKTLIIVTEGVVCRNCIHDNYCTETDKDNFTIQQIFIELNISIGVRSSYSVSQAAMDNPAREYINESLLGNITIMTLCCPRSSLGFSSSSFHFRSNFVVVHEHEQHDVVIVMFPGRLSLIYSLAGLSIAA